MRCSNVKNLNATPGALVFGRDMFLDLPFQADLIMINQRRQQVIDENLRRQNRKRRNWNYAVNQEALIKSVDPKKLEPRAHGPYTITQAFANGAVNVRRGPHVIERMNIRRLVPFRRN